MIKRFTLILMSCMFILGAWIVVKPEHAYACSCALPALVSDEMDRKTAIFSGKVVSVTHPEQKEIMSTADPVTITLDVDTVRKGQLGDKTITIGSQGSSEPSGTVGSSGTLDDGDDNHSIVSSKSSYLIPLVGLVVIIGFVFMLFTFRRRK